MTTRSWSRLVRLVVAAVLTLLLASIAVRGFAPAPAPPVVAPTDPAPRTELMSCPYPHECYAMGVELERDGYAAAAESMYAAACSKGVARACEREADSIEYRTRRR